MFELGERYKYNRSRGILLPAALLQYQGFEKPIALYLAEKRRNVSMS